jgi:hypothetical protein
MESFIALTSFLALGVDVRMMIPFAQCLRGSERLRLISRWGFSLFPITYF